ncbi:hypothetical protein Tco_1101486 [Tanacetum coccineum]
MDLETAQINTTAKFPTLKQENGNSFKLAAKTTTNADGTQTILIPGPVNTEEKASEIDHESRQLLEVLLNLKKLLPKPCWLLRSWLFDWAYGKMMKSLQTWFLLAFSDLSRKGLRFVCYNVVPPPPTGSFSPPNLDLSYSGLEELQQPEFEGYGPKTSKNVYEDTSNEVKESPNAPLVKELVLDDKLEKKTVFPTVAKIDFVRAKQQKKPVRKLVKYAEMYMSQSPRGNQRN